LKKGKPGESQGRKVASLKLYGNDSRAAKLHLRFFLAGSKFGTSRKNLSFYFGGGQA